MRDYEMMDVPYTRTVAITVFLFTYFLTWRSV